MKYRSTTIRESLKLTRERIKNVIKLSNRSIKRIFDLTQIETILDLCFNVLERDDRGGTINEGFRSEIFPRFLDRGFIVTFDRHRVRICTDFTSGGNYNVTGAERRSINTPVDRRRGSIQEERDRSSAENCPPKNFEFKYPSLLYLGRWRCLKEGARRRN